MSTKEIRILPVIWRRLFTSPHLSRTLILSSGLVIFTNMMVVFISQPAGYWVDYRYASVGNVWLQQVMAYHPAAFAGLMLGYVLLLWLLLDGLTFRAALVVWMGVAFVHLYDIYGLADDALFRNVQLAPLWLELSSIGIVLGLAAGLGVVIERVYPDERVAHKRPLQSRRASWNWKGLAFGAGWCALLLFGLIYTIQRPFTGWREITPEAGPGRVAGAGVAYDSSRQRTVMFGGASDWTEAGWEYGAYTYEWDGDRWHLFHLAKYPAARAWFSMAYDEGRQVVVLFGGEGEEGMLGDTWEWDGESWTQITPPTAPAVRGNHKLFYDPQREKVVLYGGFDGERFYNDGWEWDGQSWKQIELLTGSPYASGFLMFYEPQNQRYVAQLSWDETWIWQGNRWEPQPDSTSPSTTLTAAAYDPLHERAVVFGGIRDDLLYADTWFFENDGWKRVNTAVTPRQRWGHVTFFDPQRERIVIIGGIRDGNVLGDMWELEVAGD